jgi:hypothetical protein
MGRARGAVAAAAAVDDDCIDSGESSDLLGRDCAVRKRGVAVPSSLRNEVATESWLRLGAPSLLADAASL